MLFVHRVLSYLDKWGHRHKALKAFEWMQLQGGEQHAFDTKDTFLYTRLMTMFSRRSSDCSQALHIFDSMQSRGIKPDLVAYNTAINAAGEPFQFVSGSCIPSQKQFIMSLCCHLLPAQPDLLFHMLSILYYTILGIQSKDRLPFTHCDHKAEHCHAVNAEHGISNATWCCIVIQVIA